MAANSIGNDKDIPSRSLEALQIADVVVFEEDRQARRALKNAHIHRDYIKYTEHHEKETLQVVAEALSQGKTVCYMSDQGMPTVADPGRDLLTLAYQKKAKVSVIPGPCSISAALAACPFLINGYRFIGFTPREKAERDAALKHHVKSDVPLVILDTPYRLMPLLSSCLEIFGGDRRAILALDISGAKEEFRYETLSALTNEAAQFEDKRNFVLIISGEEGAKKPSRK
jgi:16S rRNA (cytidine1402-2'-O)-methyltransferase